MTLAESPLEELLRLLNLEQIEEDLFRGHHPKGRKHRLFGGQIIAQALMAAARTVEKERPVHSLHSYFLRPGDPSTPAIFEVERIRDGRSFSTRRIVVIQRGQAIFNMDASFQIDEPGLAHSIAMPDLPPPDESRLTKAMYDRPFLSLHQAPDDHTQRRENEPTQYIWLKTSGPVPADPLIHTALLSYESDSALLGTSRIPHMHSVQRKQMQVASLDHSIWYHKPVDVGEWLLYSLTSPNAAHARGYSRGTIHTQSGVLVASCIQEGLIRVHETK